MLVKLQDYPYGLVLGVVVSFFVSLFEEYIYLGSINYSYDIRVFGKDFPHIRKS